MEQRGYGAAHRKLGRCGRLWWPLGDVVCSRPECPYPGRLIVPGQAWDLDHTEDRVGRTSGRRTQLCNRRAGAIKGNRARGARRRQRVTSESVVSVAESVERELGTLGDGAAETVLAATARVLAEQLDRRVSWAIAKELRETMAALHAMAPPKREADRSDDLAERRRKARAARGAAS
jgi:hypothetical protein